jgi:arylsulfatase A-like enzyme
MRNLVSLYFPLIFLLCSGTLLSSDKPNFLVIMVDDMGYSDPMCFGGEIDTPNLNDLADGGLRFTQFYNCARCCPTRASLLTGSYPHRVGLARNGKTLAMTAPTLAELLKTAGYQTGMTGKWHLSELALTHDNQQRIRWMDHQLDLGIPFADPATYPRRRGFDHYYGVIWGVVDYFDPFSLVHQDAEVKDVPSNFYLTDSITDYSVDYIHTFDKKDEAPFFLYVAYTAPHWPLHAKIDDIQKYKGKYDAGWNELKINRFERQKEMKLFSQKTPIDPVIDRGNSWDQLTAAEKSYQAGKMEVHAAMIDSVDQGIGRIIGALRETGELENTIIFFLSDNGASPEIPGYAGYDRNGQTRDGKIAHRERELKLTEHRNKLGSAESYAGLGPAWANATNSPLRYWKKESFEGGCRTPLIVHWPAGIGSKAGEITTNIGHVMDIAPTCLELAGAKQGNSFSMDGESLAGLLQRNEVDLDRILYFEHMGGRAARYRQWKISALSGQPWELFNIQQDPAETTNLAIQQPIRLEELSYRWNDWFKSMPSAPKSRSKPAPVKIANHPLSLSCTASSGQRDGVLFALGGSQQGVALHIKKAQLTFSVRINGELRSITSDPIINQNPIAIEAILAKDAKMSLKINGKIVATGMATGLIPVQPQDGLSVNDDEQSNVGNYPDPFRYDGEVTQVRLGPLKHSPNEVNQSNQAENKAPNFIVILSDDQGWGTTSIPYDPQIKQSKSDFFHTPNMQRIAAAGMRFTQAYSAHTNCSPSRAALLTGISPAALHFSDIVDRNAGKYYIGNRLTPPTHVNNLDSETVTIPERLKAHNSAYMTAHFGKWHLNGGGPQAHGFDAGDGATGNREGGLKTNLPDDPKRAFSITRSSVNWMKEQVSHGSPFYLQLSHYATHLGYQSQPETIAQLESRKAGKRHNNIPFGGMIEDLDTSLGQLLDAVEHLGILDNTYIIYTADNGTYPTTDPENINGPLRGSKATLWEAGVRVPLIISGPGIKAGTLSRQKAVGYDILPTICDILGINDLDERVEGGSLMPALHETGKVIRPRNELYFHWPHYQHQKLSKPDSTIIDGDYKLHYFWESGEFQLFNLSKDIAESNNLAETYPKKAVEMNAKLQQYLRDIKAQLPTRNKSYTPKNDPVLQGRQIMSGSPLNIVLVMADDLAWMDLACQGNPLVETPHLDKFASEGIRFTSAYAAAPVCSPTRAALITGLSPARLRITNHIPDRPQFTPDGASHTGAEMFDYLAPSYTTIAERLKDAGYATGFFGKWHIAGTDTGDKGQGLAKYYPENQGFDVNIGGCIYGGPPTFFDPYRIHNLANRKTGEYLPNRLADEVCQFIDKADGSPFFTCLWNYSVHWPMEAPDHLLKKYESKTGPGLNDTRYGAMIEALDTSFGKIMAHLDKRGLSDNTLVIFTSDNGGFAGVSDNRPLRESKGHIYEGGIRVPLMIRWPNVISPGQLNDTPVISMDFFPTILDACHLEAEPLCDGVSLTPLFYGKRISRSNIFFHFPNYAWHRSNSLAGAVRSGDYKLVRHYITGGLELYNVTKDLSETNNLAAARPKLAERLNKDLSKWLQQTEAAMPRKLPPE